MGISTPAAVGRSPIRWWAVLPALTIHALCLGAIWVGWSWLAVAMALGLYLGRMFVVTAFYHRYFSHRTFRTSRVGQFVFAALGVTAAQRGPLWWAAHHREHHRHSDEPEDLHSPAWYGVLWSHTLWFLSDLGRRTNLKAVPDLARYPELRFVDRWHMLGPLFLAAAMYGLGVALERWAPALGTNGPQMLVWGFAISTTALYHATFTINSLAHRFGRRRFDTNDDSRNNFALALLTLGEGWHNNHHYFPGSARQGFYWWEIDLTYYGLLGLSWLGVVWDVRRVPGRVYAAAAGHRRSRDRGAS
ncbi:MAG: acyl-CoA desaturase [Phycisphaerales bacterium]